MKSQAGILAAVSNTSLETRPYNVYKLDQQHREYEQADRYVLRIVEKMTHSVASPLRMVSFRLVLGSCGWSRFHGLSYSPRQNRSATTCYAKAVCPAEVGILCGIRMAARGVLQMVPVFRSRACALICHRYFEALMGGHYACKSNTACRDRPRSSLAAALQTRSMLKRHQRRVAEWSAVQVRRILARATQLPALPAV